MARRSGLFACLCVTFCYRHRLQACPLEAAEIRLRTTGSSPSHPHEAAPRWLPTATHARTWRADEGFDGCPRGAVSQRPESQRPVIAQLLPDGRREVRGLEVSSLCFGSLEARRAVVGGVQA